LHYGQLRPFASGAAPTRHRFWDTNFIPASAYLEPETPLDHDESSQRASLISIALIAESLGAGEQVRVPPEPALPLGEAD
jgi:hypothetical protein